MKISIEQLNPKAYESFKENLEAKIISGDVEFVPNAATLYPCLTLLPVSCYFCNKVVEGKKGMLVAKEKNSYGHDVVSRCFIDHDCYNSIKQSSN
jgi:hypothetical protein